MGRRRLSRELRPLLLAAAILPWCGCTSHAGKSAASLVATANLPASGTVPVQKAKALRQDLIESEDRVRELEQQLAERDRQIATVQGQIDAERGHAGSGPKAPAPPAAAPAPAPAVPSAAAAPPAPAPAAAPATQDSAAQLAAQAPSAPAAAASGPAPETVAAVPVDERVAGAQKRIAKLEQQLASEQRRRQEVESEMKRLLQETSAGPYEHADNVVEKHLREQLDRAHKEITELRTSLTTERRDRAELERRFAILQAQVGATAKPAATNNGASSEEVEALKERQRRVLASIQQDLEASKQREVELRQSLESAQGPDGVSLADAVGTLRAENSALQMRLDDEHRRNGDLSAKLQLATKVTDLIFRMQNGAGQPVAVAAPPMAH
jgi:septal ring factor EnvC (AmiA/AmiB activator)